MIFFLSVVTLALATEVNLMMPLDTVNSNGVNNKGQLQNDLNKIKSGGVAGVMADVWWGLVETSPRNYNWNGYKELVQMVKKAGLKFQAVMSFHKCGGNVGDSVTIEIPQWVRNAGAANDAFFKDNENNVNNEYISFAYDDSSIFEGRTPIEIYKDFMTSFKQNFQSYIDDGTINEIQVGMGPCGETRYPSYPLSRWSYCGVGEFQCNDGKSKELLKKAATDKGHSEWGNGSPSNAGNYNSKPPSSTGFFGNGFDNYQSEYGRFFQEWYFDLLLSHTDKVLSAARNVFGNTLALAGKISGVHWWYNDQSHAAEMTAGYYNSNGNDAYKTLSNTFKNNNVRFDFTCLEMSGTDGNCGSSPANLVDQAFNAAGTVGIGKCGENALELCGYGGCNTNGFNQIINKCKQHGLTAFTYLRMTRGLLDDGNAWGQFTNFVSRMK
ncbi:beta-amylase putative [Entamoeba histolytica]|uniref:Beta-amylase n=4 Tax=Entamoeba histolytica TaxID=5759 RepID=B1N2L4_ENTH1|nr:beta-amylase, putative [Entamoeba histolytica HM-1:IMSS]XP_001913556.1 beta-amylase, putative [Entamoeba histolytica HM-1:IMSS]XP_657459.1 beta-amylase, putative [Entamoeba histolytica HM-1:IMSS]XP_657585.1 beta-amylase, putative [Entamoeba histolytica HM-1:IMSS]EMD48494.1 betaamylase precursor, putative [Entamoeba histolytica KU27]GAT91720.1 beta-amylase putative [Entamoeba histolytica]EAL52073.1 beta-amylase, putative [Entamoeba histolytica HM-1:IMSS]EAL52176.1 beta-amylase, putative [E|eukprot:XP_001913430.1 beta-amylase, putative [Entamoeba histolytica HM-1:IMSS]